MNSTPLRFRYVWEHLDIGYMQGMCDLVAPLLVIFDDESLSYGCFCRLMERMIENFPNGGAMDMHFANMRYDSSSYKTIFYIHLIITVQHQVADSNLRLGNV